ncbi:MAG: PEP-CTERM sorting domain-containing protein [Planctomycetota bacterium]
MKKQTCIVLVALVCMGVTPIQGAAITYISHGSGQRPTMFEGVEWEGNLYDVSVAWGGTIDSNYGTSLTLDTLFWGDPNGANGAAHTLRELLLNDGYLELPDIYGSNVVMPYSHSNPAGPNVEVWSVALHDFDVNTLLNVQHLALDRRFNYGTIGHSEWALVGPVIPEPSSLGLIGMSGLLLIRRNRY